MRVLPWPSPHIVHDITPGTERMRRFLSALGNPERRVPPVIHVAGTNGKGSTIQFLRAIFAAQGYRTHTYTSPHLRWWNERILVDGVEVSDYTLHEALDECRVVEQKSGMTVSHFEGFTAAAILLFASSPADVTLIETGLGGRDDATNIWNQLLASVITPISRDHQEFLGQTLGEIAMHKAGIMKRGAPCIVAPQCEAVRPVLRAEAQRCGVTVCEAGVDWFIERTEEGGVVRYSHPTYGKAEECIPEPSLPGAHQYHNAATAVMTCHLVADALPTTAAARAHGIRSARWPGRLHHLRTGALAEQLPPRWELWCDAAHNEGGAAVLVDWLASHELQPLIVIAGCSRGRSLEAFINNLYLHPEARVIAIEGVINDIAIGRGTISSHTPQSPPIETVSSLEYALLRARTIAEQFSSGRIIVTGSLLLVGALLELNDR